MQRMCLKELINNFVGLFLSQDFLIYVPNGTLTEIEVFVPLMGDLLSMTTFYVKIVSQNHYVTNLTL